MRLREGDVASMVEDALIAGKEKGLREIARAPATRDVGNRLIITKTGESIVGAREIVVHPDVKLGFIEFANRLVHEIGEVTLIIGVRVGIESNQLFADSIEQVGWDFVAVGSFRLASIRICQDGVAAGIALETSIGGASHVRVDEGAGSASGNRA